MKKQNLDRFPVGRAANEHLHDGLRGIRGLPVEALLRGHLTSHSTEPFLPCADEPRMG